MRLHTGAPIPPQNTVMHNRVNALKQEARHQGKQAFMWPPQCSCPRLGRDIRCTGLAACLTAWRLGFTLPGLKVMGSSCCANPGCVVECRQGTERSLGMSEVRGPSSRPCLSLELDRRQRLWPTRRKPQRRQQNRTVFEVPPRRRLGPAELRSLARPARANGSV